MAKVLRLHKESNDNIIDWGKSKKYGKDVITQIEDPAGMTAKKEITSIPSPFARVDLTKTAFKTIDPLATRSASRVFTGCRVRVTVTTWTPTPLCSVR